MSLGEYNGAGSGTTKLLLHLNGNSTDSSGNSNSGTDTSITYSQANGKFGQGAGFNGSSSKIVVPYNSSLDTNNITISTWVKFTATPPANASRIIERDSGSGATRLWILGTNASDTTIGFVCWDSAGTISQAESGGYSLSQNVWHHVVGIWDGVSVKRYVDGLLYGTSVAATGNLRGGNQPLQLGNDYPGIGRPLTGEIDEVIIENVAWSAEKVKQYYTFTKGRFGII